MSEEERPMSETTASFPFHVRWTGDKQGGATAAGVECELTVASPPEFGGPGRRWTPEHLYVGAATSCWLTTFLAVAELSKLEVAAVEVQGEGAVERGEDRRYSIPRIVLRPRVTVVRDGDRERALRLIEKAETACLVARSMRTEIRLEPHVEVGSATETESPAIAELAAR